MGSHSVTCHPTQVNAPRLNPSQINRYLICLPWRDERLSWPKRLVTYRNGLPAHRQSPIQVLTRPVVEQLRWSDTTRCAFPLRHATNLNDRHSYKQYVCQCEMRPVIVTLIPLLQFSAVVLISRDMGIASPSVCPSICIFFTGSQVNNERTLKPQNYCKSSLEQENRCASLWLRSSKSQVWS